MKTKIIKIVNSKRAKISKPRELWNSAFKKMSENKDDVLLDSKELHVQSSWDKEMWKW